MRSAARNKTFRLDQQTLDDIRSEQQRLEAENDGLRVSEADALRVLVRRALGTPRSA